MRLIDNLGEGSTVYIIFILLEIIKKRSPFPNKPDIDKSRLDIKMPVIKPYIISALLLLYSLSSSINKSIYGINTVVQCDITDPSQDVRLQSRPMS
jgi:hypothetical protein